ncbi:MULTISPECIES: hypothetical protein [Corallincola]|uniref:Anti-sigma factor n=2 Tax=Corallincola TaxID=1775176 RepID=A0ABY1WNG2_9GAMM|nr:MULTISPECIES: hypothetical protein [Corallincola]TAA45094.1 hypothetical protein EXY25_12870 [Corallincola spongiicola]TCI03626.1 hypothetical protein EZV61_08765 [Corallincola luteus]
MTDSQPRPFKQACQDYFAAVQLDEQELKQLHKRFQSVPEAVSNATEAPQRHRQDNKEQTIQRRMWLGLAATLCAFALVLWHNLPMQSTTALNLAQLIADEVVANHRKLKPLEVQGQELKLVRGYFRQLSFQPIDSAQLQQWQLTGGRYCSIQGVDAAQLRYTDSEGGLSTLYQIALPTGWGKELFAERAAPAVMLYSAGYRVRIWQEKGLLLAQVTAD